MENNDLERTMADALVDLEKSVDPETIDSEETSTEEQTSEIEFDLKKSEDLADFAEVKESFLDVDPFFAHITELVSTNNTRIAKAVEGLLNLAKSQNSVITNLLEKVSSLSAVVDEMANTPGERKGALSHTEASQMQKSLFGREFVSQAEPEAPASDLGVSPRFAALGALQKSWQLAAPGSPERDSLGNALIRLNSIPGEYPLESIVEHLTEDARRVILDALGKSSA